MPRKLTNNLTIWHCAVCFASFASRFAAFAVKAKGGSAKLAKAAAKLRKGLGSDHVKIALYQPFFQLKSTNGSLDD
ncbi:MAG: hypothetical protein ABJB61_04720 [bacterium]